jgi:hypothetical protein
LTIIETLLNLSPAQDEVRKVDIVISDSESVPVERFTFSLERRPQGPVAEPLTVPDTIDPAELRKALRNLLTRLNYADALMDALPEGTLQPSFSFTLHCIPRRPKFI